jgi:biopolymer transport protein ExbD
MKDRLVSEINHNYMFSDVTMDAVEQAFETNYFDELSEKDSLDVAMEQKLCSSQLQVVATNMHELANKNIDRTENRSFLVTVMLLGVRKNLLTLRSAPLRSQVDNLLAAFDSVITELQHPHRLGFHADSITREMLLHAVHAKVKTARDKTFLLRADIGAQYMVHITEIVNLLQQTAAWTLHIWHPASACWCRVREYYIIQSSDGFRSV